MFEHIITNILRFVRYCIQLYDIFVNDIAAVILCPTSPTKKFLVEHKIEKSRKNWCKNRSI